jgi:hypothetical protein
LLRVLFGAGIGAAPAVIFVVRNLGSPVNPFEILMVCGALVDIGVFVAVSYIIVDMLFWRLPFWRRTGVPLGWRLALIFLFAACAICIGAYTRIMHVPGQYEGGALGAAVFGI